MPGLMTCRTKDLPAPPRISSSLQEQPKTQTSWCGPGHLSVASGLTCRESTRLSGVSVMPIPPLRLQNPPGSVKIQVSLSRLETISRKEHPILCDQRHLGEPFWKRTKKHVSGGAFLSWRCWAGKKKPPPPITVISLLLDPFYVCDSCSTEIMQHLQLD